MDEFVKDEIFVEDVSALRQLVEVFIRDEFFEKRPVIPDIKKILTKLTSSKIIIKSKLHRVEMLLEEITRNRARVQEIVNRMGLVLDAAVEADVLLLLKQLTSEGHLSLDQNFKIIEMKDLTMNKLITVIKETKIGRGLDFMPRKTSELLNQLKLWVSEFAEKGTSILRAQILAALDELLQRKAISKTEYNSMKNDNNALR